LRYDNGDLAFWMMNGFTATQQTIYGNVPTEWTLV